LFAGRLADASTGVAPSEGMSMSERETLPSPPPKTGSPSQHPLENRAPIAMGKPNVDDEEAQICRGID
jgi:hypothetical protein